MLRWIMHVDMDAFFASVEQMDNPALKGMPVIVGGVSGRGVVSTCSYEARKFGVHSAMPMAEAKKLCPQAVFLSGRMVRYKEVSDQIMNIFHETSPLVEQLSIDEAFLDVSGMERLYDGVAAIGAQVKRRIAAEVGLTASVGIAPNKFLAKMASDLQKPDGLTIIRHEEAQSFIAPLPVTKIFGLGKTTAQLLEQYGIVTIGQLARAEGQFWQKVFGSSGERMRLLALGIDDRPVAAEYAPKSIGRETTFDKDLYTQEECRQAVLTLSGQTGYRLRKKGYCGHTVTLKVKFADFKTVTRSITSESDVCCDEDIFALASRLLAKINVGKGVRLLGVTVSGLEDGAGAALIFEDDARQRRRNAAVDALKTRFGENIIRRG